MEELAEEFQRLHNALRAFALSCPDTSVALSAGPRAPLRPRPVLDAVGMSLTWACKSSGPLSRWRHCCSQTCMVLLCPDACVWRLAAGRSAT